MRLVSVLCVLSLLVALAFGQAVQNGNILILNICNASAPSQQWDLSHLSSDQTIRLKAPNNNMCLDIEGYGTDDGSTIWIYSCHTDDKDPHHQNQEFIYDSNAKTFLNPEANKVLDASHSGTTPGTRVWIWSKTGGLNQQWEQRPDGTIRNPHSGLCLDVAGSAARPCMLNSTKELPFCNTKLPFATRVEDLVNRIPETDKYGLLGNGAFGVFSLGIPDYQWWSEALHGVAGSPGVSFSGDTPYATSFPQPIITGAAFDVDLWGQIGAVIGKEARAFANEGHAGLTFWTPNLNIFRDPRWGRGQETPGEDPVLTSEYVRHFVPGLQGRDAKYLQISSCCKHFAAYSLESWGGVDRFSFNAIVTEQDLQDTYLPAFESCVSPSSGAASSMMCSYNAVNGIPSCADSLLLTHYARNSWGFNGYITGDCGAVDCVQNNHHYTNNPSDTCKAVLTAGMDIDCGQFIQTNLQAAVQSGSVSMDLINTRLRNLFMVQMRLGWFDPLTAQTYGQINASIINLPTSQTLAELTALRGITLLKNNKTLPLNKNTVRRVAVIGPLAQATGQMQGNYAGNAPYLISPIAGISKYATVVYEPGADIASNDTSKIPAACSAAQGADATIIVAGIDNSQESEGHDRTILSWPGVQESMILKVASCSKGPVVLVVWGGGPVDLTNQKNEHFVGGIFWAGYPGQSGGTALAKLIFGDVSPSGRLPVSNYPAMYAKQVPMTDMGMRPNSSTGNPGRTYRFYPTPVYEFGTGLSYTTFDIQWTNAEKLVYSAKKLQAILDSRSYSRFTKKPLAGLSATVKNTGSVTSDVSVLAFSVPPNPGKNGNPIKSLSSFARANMLAPGQQVTLQFPMNVHDLSLVDENGQRLIQKGLWKFMVEDSVVEVLVQ